MEKEIEFVICLLPACSQNYLNLGENSFYAAPVSAKSLQSCLTLWDPMDSCSPAGISVHGILGKNTGVCCYFLIQGILPTKGPNLHLLQLLHCCITTEPLQKPTCSFQMRSKKELNPSITQIKVRITNKDHKKFIYTLFSFWWCF